MKQPRSPTKQLSRAQNLRTGDEDQTKTANLTACGTCGVAHCEGNNFCRWCGARIGSDFTVKLRPHTSATLHQLSSLEGRHTFGSPYHLVSGPLVKVIADNVSTPLTLQRRDRLLRSVIRAVVLIPIWLVFVLLSPFDAYAAAKTVTATVGDRVLNDAQSGGRQCHVGSA